MNLEDFDRYVDEQHAKGSKLAIGEMFDQWLVDMSGSTIVGGPVDEPPTFVAVPDE